MRKTRTGRGAANWITASRHPLPGGRSGFTPGPAFTHGRAAEHLDTAVPRGQPRRQLPAWLAGCCWGLWLTTGCTLAALLWYALHAVAPGMPAAIGWVPATVSLAVAAMALRGLAVSPGLHPGAARFWDRLAVVAALGCVALAVRFAYIVPLGSAPAAGALMPLPTVLLCEAALAVAVWALLRVPVGRLRAGEWVRLLLDTVTIVLGAALVLWYASVGPLISGWRPVAAAVWSPLVIAVFCLAGLSATAKIILVGAGPVDQAALRVLGMGLLLSAVSAGTASVLVDATALVPGQAAVPAVATLIVVAAHRQRAAAGVVPPASRRRLRRAFSLLPYAALIVTDALLLVVTLGRADLRGRVVITGAVVVSLVVAVRQLTALTDNARLVRELRRQEDRLRHQAGHDPLTQLANRSLFTDELETALAVRRSRAVSVLLIDLDDFKSVNDTLGHAVGDQLLLGVAERLRQCMYADTLVARLGGDEFGVLLRAAYPRAAEAMAARLLARLATPVLANEHRLLVRASIGVAVAAPGDTSGVLLRNADIAMYAAKERGKGGFLRYVPGMATNVLEHAQLGAQLREAIDGGQLFPVFQPVMHLREHRIIGLETLVRWRHPVRGLLEPARFIPTAERTGLVVPMGRWLLAEACARLAAWRQQYGDGGPRTIGVNVSGRQLAEPTFAEDTAAVVLNAGLEPQHLVLEVTEDSVLTGVDVIGTLRELHDFGVRIALDDFGTGQSSLGLLRSCPVDILKLDKTFVDGIADGTHQAAIAAAVIGMAQAMGLDAVAEGIECDDQVGFLTGLGYHLGQGFHLAPPLTAAEVTGHFTAPSGVRGPAGPGVVANDVCRTG